MYVVNGEGLFLMRRTKEESEKTREDILNAAVEVFTAKGVARGTLEDIAKAANVTRGAIYWHFKNKMEIFDALHERLNRPLVDMIMADIEKDHPEPVAQLRDLCIQLLLGLDKDVQKRKAFVLFMQKCDYTGEFAKCKEKHCAQKAEKMRLFRRYFEKAKKAGKLPKGADPDLLTQAVGCFMKGIIYEYLENPDGFNMKSKAPKLVGLFFDNMGLTSKADV